MSKQQGYQKSPTLVQGKSLFTVHNIPSFNIEDTLPHTSKKSTSEVSPFSRPLVQKKPPLQDHHQKKPPSIKMTSYTSMSILNTSQRCCSHCNSVHTSTSSTKSRKIRAPHYRSDRQHPLTLSSYRHHCQNTNTEANTNRSPSKTTRSPSKMNRCLDKRNHNNKCILTTSDYQSRQ